MDKQSMAEELREHAETLRDVPGGLGGVIDGLREIAAKIDEHDSNLDKLAARIVSLEEEREKLRSLVKMGERVVNDFLPNIGRCVLQNYERANMFLVHASAVPEGAELARGDSK